LHALIFYLVLLVFFLFLSLFFSASETAFMAANRIRLKYQADAGDKDAETIQRILAAPKPKLVSLVELIDQARRAAGSDEQ
jgi:Mg2+/Co2+ transporter CorB